MPFYRAKFLTTVHRFSFLVAACLAAVLYGWAGSALAEKPFAHPGVLHSQAELDFVKKKVAEGEEPWKAAWEQLQAQPVSKLDWTPRPVENVVRGPYNKPDVGGTDLMRGGAAAYSQAVQWVITGEKAHADKAVAILDAYARTLKSVGGHDARLLVGMVGINFVNAAEILRHTDAAWSGDNQQRFEYLLRQVFYPVIKDFYPTANGNWDAAMIQTMMAMGVFLDDRAMFERAVDYYLHGEGNGAITHYINDFGECQESGRDQGHTQMGLGYLGCAAEIAWKQGVDLYGAHDNRLALGYEYTAKYNLGHDVPYEPYRSHKGRYHYQKISDKGRGRFSSIYERVYHHYHDRAGLDMPYTGQVVEKIRPETWQSAFTPWGTLMYAELPAFREQAESDGQAAHDGHRAGWLHAAGWGVMTHYLGAPPSSAGGAELTAEMWNGQVDAFDVEGLADQIASTGAKYLLFTIGQNSGHYCSPNATYDEIVGIQPSKCSRRDLVADLAAALKSKNIALLVYLPSGAPAADHVARKKLGWRWGRPGGWQLPGEPVGGRLAEFQRHWESVIREWSVRWGEDVAGWWIDGCYFADDMYRFDDAPNFASFAAALRAGNPDAIVAFNPGVKVPVTALSRHEDYTAGEVTLPQLPQAVETCPGRWLEWEGAKLQFHLLTYLGTSWCRGDRPQWPDEKVIDYTKKIIAKGGAVTFDVPIQTSGLIPEPFVQQLRAIGEAVRPAGS